MKEDLTDQERKNVEKENLKRREGER